MNEQTANLIRIVASQFDFTVQQQVERLIKGGSTSRHFAIEPGFVVAIAALIVATVSMTCSVINVLRQSGVKPKQTDVERRVILELVPPQGISEGTIAKIVTAAVAEALKSQE
ncbi:hypothetical protein M2352_004914 [Azospirillum fermentarium]|uniref:hypothetical protein n=1 Tax=Azospirillum fermentarium TaxID=1233114 RepID=UPI0022280DB9|nr:hypothetical protein [Azospirillum fermentarium]MCW2249254.1 hypothetical protein [Azospirillum fermentarium]